MKSKSILLYALAIIQLTLLSVNVRAIPAYPHPVVITQPDGSKITVLLKGDEHNKWAQTPDGYTLMYNSEGIYEYAMIDAKSNMVPSGIKASDVDLRSSVEKNFLNQTPKNLTYSESQLSTLKTLAAIYENEFTQQAFPTTGTRNLVCILIGYTDKAFSKTQSDFNNLFNQIGYSAGTASGSVKDFYKEASYNQLDLSITVAGPYTASNNMAYYGANDASGYDIRPRELVTEAVNKADPDVNFANFDNDNNGTVDGVYVIYAGYGEEAGGGANCIWAHAWSIPTVVKDGKYINSYSCSAELRGNYGTSITSIGVICHEFGHVLGAPDFYDIDYSTGGQFIGTGDWDMMASGSWNDDGDTPAEHNPYTKIYVYNWATATVLSSAANISVSKAETDKSFYRINSTTTNEFWLIENRQKVGFDANIPGHGLLIYHAHKDLASSSSINSTYPQKFYPVCASATTNPGTTPASYGSINSSGCPYPGTANKTQFTDATTPNMKSWAGANTNKPITNIVENTSTGIITFDFMGGVVNPAKPTATTGTAGGITTSAATLNGQVSANNATTTITFEYGTTTSYGSTVNASPNTLTGSTLTSVSANISGLTANTVYHFRVKAVNSAGTTYGSDATFTTLSGGTSVTLPISQSFSSSSMPDGWTTQNIGSGITERWSISNTNRAGGSAYEAKMSYQNVNPGQSRLITPAINTTGVNAISLTFKTLLDDYGTGATLVIQSSTDKVNWTNEAWSLASKSNTNVGPSTVTTTISNNLNSATTYVAFAIVGNLYQIDYWYIDDISLTQGSSQVTYCDSKGSNSSYEWIDLVSLSNMSNTSSSDGGYKDYTSKVANLTPGTNYTLSFSCGFKSSSYTEYWKAWIDYNHDGSFDTSEEIASTSSSSSGTLTSIFTVPSGAGGVTTRMRVSMKYDGVPSSCGSFSYGEVEDYTVSISSSAPENRAPEEQLSLSQTDKTGVLLFPNPVVNVLNINHQADEVTIRIYNNTGMLMKTVNATNSKAQVDVSNLPAGVYVVTGDNKKLGVFTKQ